jgi:hypothetical protein
VLFLAILGSRRTKNHKKWTFGIKPFSLIFRNHAEIISIF